MTLRTNVSYHQISKRPTLSYISSNFSHSYIKLLHNWILSLQANIFKELHSMGLLQIWNVWETGISDNLDWTKESEVKRAEMWLCWERQGLLLPLWAGTTSSPLPSTPLPLYPPSSSLPHSFPPSLFFFKVFLSFSSFLPHFSMPSFSYFFLSLILSHLPHADYCFLGSWQRNWECVFNPQVLCLCVSQRSCGRCNFKAETRVSPQSAASL